MQITQKIIPKSLWGLKCPHSMTPVSYTHLDVYKRQDGLQRSQKNCVIGN